MTITRRIHMLVAVMTVPMALCAAAAAGPAPIHEYRFAGSGADSAAGADGTVGSNLAFTSAGVPAGLGRAMIVGTNGTHPNHVINVPNADFIDFGAGDFSIAFWVRRDNADSGNVDGICDALSGTGRGWEVFFTSSDTLSVRLDDDNGNTAQYDSTTIFADNLWHHIVISVDRNAVDGLRIYVDGAFDSAHDPTPISGNIDPNQNLWIGGRNDSNSQGLEGELAILQIFDSALTAIDAADLSAIGFPIHQYNFESDGVDSAGSADGAVGVNVSFNSVDVPVELGQAAVFGSDGGNADNRIDVPLASVTDFGLGDFSISIWIKRDVNSGSTQGILDNLGNDGTQLQFLGNDILRARIDDDLGNESRPESLTAITDLGWHHLLLTIDRDAVDGAKWYIDGQLDNSDDPTVLTGSILADQDLRIGTINGLGLRGQLAQLTFYDAALSANDALDLADLDRDGVPYALDACLDFDDNLDADVDAVPDACDNCPGDANMDQLDSDSDGVGDACDICPGFDDALDADADGVPDGCDACIGFDDTLDGDADGVADDCDACTGASQVDSDGDGICDEFDVCAGDDALCTVPANVICVWAMAPGAQDGSNWFNAYRDLSAALAAANSGDEVWVAASTYYPDGGYRPTGGAQVFGSGVRSDSFYMESGVAIYGGFRGNESMREQRDWDTNVTILSGDIDGDGTFAGNSFHVMLAQGNVGPTAVLDGVTITFGNADGAQPHHEGGGMLNDGSPTLANCIFRGNTTRARGGGMEHSGSSTLFRCTFIDNSTVGTSLQDGAGMHVIGSPTLIECGFFGNRVEFGFGGGISVIGSPSLDQCVFSGNSTTGSGGSGFGSGGGVYISSGSPRVTNCVFTNNTAVNSGGGVATGSGTSRWLTNCIFWGNSDSGGMDSSAQINSSNGSTIVDHCNIQGGWPGVGVNNIATDPLFVDADGPDDVIGTPDDDLRVLAGSPCIDAGSNAAVPAGVVTDPDGTARFSNCIVDIGVYEFADSVPADSDGDGFTDGCDVCPGADDRADGDGDGVPDDCDICAGASQSDADGDGICDEFDACAGDDALCTVPENVLCVWSLAPGAQDGSNWFNAFRDLRSALLAAAPGNEIWVAAGTYYPDGGYRSPGGPFISGIDGLGRSFQMESGVAIYGGFTGSESLREQRDWETNVTVLSGDIHGDGTLSGNSYHVVEAVAAVDSTAVLDGFTITQGNASFDGADDEGGGVYCTGSPTLTNCVFTGNASEDAGGGMFISAGSPTISYCAFLGNSVTSDGGSTDGDGGGMFINDGAPTIFHCVFSGNSAEMDGGAICQLAGSATFTECVMGGNSAENRGGGMFTESGAPSLLDGCSFSENSADYGGGIFFHDVDELSVIGCTFTENTADIGGGGYSGDFAAPEFTDCVFNGNVAGDFGGGSYNNLSIPEFTRCEFSGNSTGIDGGGMYSSNAFTPSELTHCTFSGNSAGRDGGGMYSSAASTPSDLTYCTFSGNSAERHGGGIYNGGGSTTSDLMYCTFYGNSAVSDGGGMYIGGAGLSSNFTHCVFSGNSADEDGGGMYNEGGGTTPELTHCVFSANSAVGDGGGIHENLTALTLTNCILWGNVDSGGMDESAQYFRQFVLTTLNYCNLQGGWTGNGANNINSDPLFTDADGADNIFGTEDDDLTLLAGSPCIDAGDNGAVPAGVVTDLAGNIRRVDDPAAPDTGVGLCAIVDMGPYEFQAGAGDDDSDADGVCDSMDVCPGFDDHVDADADGVPDGCDPCPTIATGDVNGDTFVDAGDAASFVAVLLDPGSATADELCAADVNEDFVVDGEDVQAFVNLILSP